MASYNRVILLGNLTRDPQLRYLPSNTAVCEFGLAMNRRYKDRDGNQKEEVCFVDIEAFGRQAETINQYVTKGRPLLVEGRLRLDSWTGQDGQKHSRLRVIVENFQFVGGRGDQPTGGGATYDRGTAPAGRPQPGPPSDAPLPPEPDEVPPAGDNIPF
jgi:single-strand DNA-binding protein